MLQALINRLCLFTTESW